MKTLLIIATIVVAGFSSHARSATEEYGLELISSNDQLPWKPREIQAINELLATLPEKLTKIAKISDLRKVKVSRTFARERDSHQSNFLGPFWHIELSLPGLRESYDKLEDRDENDASDQRYLVQLQRELIHRLLHLYDNVFEVSKKHNWRSISGWRYQRLFGVKLWHLDRPPLNQDPRAYGTLAGMASPAEDFATFGEEYFFPTARMASESIKCRAPRKFAFFSTMFEESIDRFADVHCVTSDDGFLDDITFIDPITKSPLNLGPVNEDTVKGFEILYATPGVGDAAEIAGHLVLRVKLKNNPLADRFGIENPNDLVISFLADTDPDKKQTKRLDSAPVECKDTWFAQKNDPTNFDALGSVVQALKGLSGGFLSTFDRQTLQQTVRMYTGYQDRNLIRYELNLSASQKKSLIERLYLAKLNWKSKYYFFDRNCASILVQIIGEGIGDREVAEFDPFVVPPNALIALLTRKGLAHQVYPSFHSYRKRAQFAQKLIEERYGPEMDSQNLFHQNESVRQKAWRSVLKSPLNESEARYLYQLASLGQESEHEFIDREKLCENVTSKPTELMRTTQSEIISEFGPEILGTPINLDHEIHHRSVTHEKTLSNRGTHHTGLSSFGLIREQSQNKQLTTIYSLNLHKQEMGSRSANSMQRATAVDLGSVVVGTKDSEVSSWEFTGLLVRKLKERLDHVPVWFEEKGKFGIGLGLLNISQDFDRGRLKNEWGRGEFLFNLISSDFYEKHLFVSTGLSIDSFWIHKDNGSSGGRYDSLSMPISLNGLWSFTSSRAFQMRMVSSMKPSFGPRFKGQESDIRVTFQYVLPYYNGAQFLFNLYGGYRQESWKIDEAKDHNATPYFALGFEVNRW